MALISLRPYKYVYVDGNKYIISNEMRRIEPPDLNVGYPFIKPYIIDELIAQFRSLQKPLFLWNALLINMFFQMFKFIYSGSSRRLKVCLQWDEQIGGIEKIIEEPENLIIEAKEEYIGLV